MKIKSNQFSYVFNHHHHHRPVFENNLQINTVNNSNKKGFKHIFEPFSNKYSKFTKNFHLMSQMNASDIQLKFKCVISN